MLNRSHFIDRFTTDREYSLKDILNETTKETKAKIANGTYILTDLNGGK